MASFKPDRINVEGLGKLLKAVKGKPPVAKIGILGNENVRGSEKGQSNVGNATIGAVHEYGSVEKGIPARSILRVPLSEDLQAKMNSSGAFDDAVAKEVIKSGSVIPWLEKVAILGEEVVLENFNAEGRGRWPKWKDPNYTNNTGKLLQDTTQLRDSITSEVKK